MKVTSTDQAQHLPPVPEGFLPEGVSLTCFDQETLSFVEHALPARLEGLKIFAHLLSYGTLDPHTSMQQRLCQATGETQQEVIVLLRSVHALAKSPGSPCGPETYLKVLLILEALKILRRTFHRNYTEIRISLGKREIHIPTLLKALGQLHDDYRNKKVKHIANKVIRLLQSGEFSTSVPTPIAPDLAPVAEILTSLLGEHGVERVDVPRLAEACTLIAQAIQSGRVAEHKGEFVGQLKDGTWQVSVKKGASRMPSGELLTKESPILGEQQPDGVVGSGKTRPGRGKSGDSEALFTRNSPVCGSDGQILGKSGEFNADVSIIVPDPSDITTKTERTIIDATTTTRPSESASVDHRSLEEIRREAKFYESFFDHGRSRQWTGSLINVLKTTPTEAKHLAAVGAVYYSYFPQPDGRTIYSPGGWFTSACRRYGQPGSAVPFEIRAWSETNLPLKEIRKRIKEGCRLPSEVALPEVNTPVESDEQQVGPRPEGEMASAWFADSPTAYPLPYQPQSGCMRTWMDHEQAMGLRDRMVREGVKYGLQAVVLSGRGSRWTVQVTWPENGVQVEIMNEEDWVDYFTGVKECLDLQAGLRG